MKMIPLSDRSAEWLKKKQTELTRLANGLDKQTGHDSVFSAEEQAAIKKTINLLRSFKNSVQHEKEKAERAEQEHNRQVDRSTKAAVQVLKTRIATLSLQEKLTLVVRNDLSSGWPYGQLSVVVETLNTTGLGGRNGVYALIESALSELISSAACSMGHDAHSSWRAPIPVSEPAAEKHIQRAMNGRGYDGSEPFDATLGQIIDRINELEKIDASGNVEAVNFKRK